MISLKKMLNKDREFRMNIKVSIIIPTFNRSQLLSKAIESALDQDYENLEVVISDNNSDDNTQQVVDKYLKKDKNRGRLKYFINSKNLGMVGNWRKALNEYIDGDFFLILSDDDYLIDNNYISKAISLLEKDSSILSVYANGYIINESLNKFYTLSLPFNEIEEGKTIFLSRGKIIPQDLTLCNVIFNRNKTLELNSFSNDKNLTCDSELFLKLCLLGKIGVVKDFVSVYRLHSNNLIDKLGIDYEFFMNNIDHLTEPYNLAKKEGLLSEEELKVWEDGILKRSFQGTLSTVITYYGENYNLTLDKLSQKNPEVLEKALNDPKFSLFLKTRKIGLFKILVKVFEKFSAYKYSKKGQNIEKLNFEHF
ncbi:MAG: glycosyltransferase family 2 protein [Methanobacteriaceae archaeon]|nr:glycosyltransferase family 2 protein [Methanobacteriaceae archaeon]